MPPVGFPEDCGLPPAPSLGREKRGPNGLVVMHRGPKPPQREERALLKDSGKGWVQGVGWGGVLGAHLTGGYQPPPCRCPPSVSPAASVPRGSTRTPAGSVCPPKTARVNLQGCPTPGVPSSTLTV